MYARNKQLLPLVFCWSLMACVDDSAVVAPPPSLAVLTALASAVPERNLDRDAGGASKRYSDDADSVLFDQASAGDTVFVVGLKIPGTRRGAWRGEVFVEETVRASSHASLRNPSMGFRIVGADSILPVVYVKVSSRSALSKLRHFPFVDYVEPNAVGKGYSMHSGDPCAVPAPGLPIAYDSYGEIVNPPWVTENIVAAWAVNQGQGATLGLADAAIDLGQREFYVDPSVLGTGFNSGQSAGRLFEQMDPAPGSTCTHATRMAILMAAPRNGIGTNGVAWKASLRSGGSVNGPDIQFGPAMTQIMLGVRYAANETDVSRKHVVAMAFGQVTHSDLLSDEINRLYYSRDVLFIGAAGTNVPNYPGGGSDVVVFPASKGEVFAVSATETDGTKNPESSSNAKVELTALSKNLVGNFNMNGWIPGASNSNTTTELNHSSAATAVISGVAALVRTRFPQMTNVQVRAQLKARTGFECSGRTDWKPLVDALAAVGSFCGVRVSPIPPVTFACTYSPAQSVTVSAPAQTGQNGFTYQWSNGSTQLSATYSVSPPQGATGLWYNTTPLSVTVTDVLSGQSRTASDYVLAKVTGGSKCRN